LKWNDYQSSFSAMMQSICLKEEMTDCTISNGSRTFYAHRMVLSTCSPYFRSLFSGLPHNQHPVIFIRDIQDSIVELLVRYMYSGQVSVAEDQIIPLVHAARSLGIKGLLDVPLPTNPGDMQQPEPVPSNRPPPLKKPKIKHQEQLMLRASPARPTTTTSTQPHCDIKTPKIETASTALVASSPEDDVEILDEDNSFEDEEEATTPAMERIDVEQAQPNELLQRLTSEITAYPFMSGLAAAAPLSPQLTIYSCEHCGKEFTSKRKHQRHVLNVHFGYNPVQCPFCQKGHRDNYNLKQHVCPVLNMKYGQFEKKEGGAAPTGPKVMDATKVVLKNS